MSKQATTTNTGSSATFCVKAAYHPNSGTMMSGTTTILVATATSTVRPSPGLPLDDRRGFLTNGFSRSRRGARSTGAVGGEGR